MFQEGLFFCFRREEKTKPGFVSRKRRNTILFLFCCSSREEQTRFCFKKKKKHKAFVSENQVLFQEKEETQSVCFRKSGFVSPRTRCCSRRRRRTRCLCLSKEQVLFKKEEPEEKKKRTGVVQEGRTRRKEMVLFFFCLFQEPLAEEPLEELLVSRTAQKQWFVAACFKNRSKKWCCSSSACFKNRLFQELKGLPLFFCCFASKNSKKRKEEPETRNQEPGTTLLVVSC